MTLLAMRWDKVVDFGSPMTAWTQDAGATQGVRFADECLDARDAGATQEKTMSKHARDPETGQMTAVEVKDALTS